MDNPDGFENWLSLKDLPKNISYKKWFEINDWVEMREGVRDNMTLSDWLSNKRSIEDTIQDASEWLAETKWNDLNEKYTLFLDEDGMSQKDWGYFKGGIDTLSVANNVNLDAAIDDMVSIKQKSGLNKYIDVFTKIGFVLVFISLLIALVSKPIKKLMHGVE